MAIISFDIRDATVYERLTYVSRSLDVLAERRAMVSIVSNSLVFDSTRALALE